MSAKQLVIGLVLVGLLVTGVVLLLPKDDAATPSPAPTAQERGPEGLPKFQADLGEAQPAEPLDVPAIEAGAERERDAAARRNESGQRAISGTVVRQADGLPLAGAKVGAKTGPFSEIVAGTVLQADSMILSVTTDAAGRFELRADPRATDVRVTSDNDWPPRTQHYEIEAGEAPLADLKLVFDSGFVIAGLVLDESGGGLAGGIVDVNRAVEGRSDETGHFLFRDVAPGSGVASVRVSARAPGHASASQDALVPRNPAEVVNVELRLPPGGAIAGRVTDSLGAALEGVQACVVFVMTSDHGEQAQGGLSATSDAHGDYLIDSVPEGRYVVEVGYGAGLARSGGMLPPDFNVALDLPSLTPSGGSADSNVPVGARIAMQLVAAKGFSPRWFPEIVVQAGQTTRLDVELFPACSVSGRVLDETGAPVVDAHLTLERIERWPAADRLGTTITTTTGLVITSSGDGKGKGETEVAEVEGEARTDARGSFEFGGLMDGEKRLHVTSAGLVSQSRALDLQPAEIKTGEDFVLERGLPVRGRVRDVTGSPIEGANVEISLLGAETITGNGLTTDADGRFEISGLPAGPKQLLVFKSGFSSLQTHVEPGAPDLELIMKPAPKVIGVVTNAVHGSPIPNFDVSIAYGGSTWSQSGSIYPEGRFEIPIDSDTPCTVTIRSGGFREVVLADVLPSHTAIEPLQIRLLPK